MAKSRLVWDSRIQTELRNRSNKRVEEAISRAAKLEKEAADARGRVADIERITAWRHISEEQRVEIAVSIEHMAGDIDLLIEYEMSNGEAFTYAREIAGIFVSAGVSKIRHSPNSYIGTGFFGVSISATFPPINLSFVTNVFSKAGVKAWSSQRVFIKTFAKKCARPKFIYLRRAEAAARVYGILGWGRRARERRRTCDITRQSNIRGQRSRIADGTHKKRTRRATGVRN